MLKDLKVHNYKICYACLLKCSQVSLFRGWPFNTGKILVKPRNGTGKVWPRPLNTGDRLIQVTNIVFLLKKIGTLKSGRLILGGRLIQGRYTGCPKKVTL